MHQDPTPGAGPAALEDATGRSTPLVPTLRMGLAAAQYSKLAELATPFATASRRPGVPRLLELSPFLPEANAHGGTCEVRIRTQEPFVFSVLDGCLAFAVTPEHEAAMADLMASFAKAMGHELAARFASGNQAVSNAVEEGQPMQILALGPDRGRASEAIRRVAPDFDAEVARLQRLAPTIQARADEPARAGPPVVNLSRAASSLRTMDRLLSGLGDGDGGGDGNARIDPAIASLAAAPGLVLRRGGASMTLAPAPLDRMYLPHPQQMLSPRPPGRTAPAPQFVPMGTPVETDDALSQMFWVALPNRDAYTQLQIAYKGDREAADFGFGLEGHPICSVGPFVCDPLNPDAAGHTVVTVVQPPGSRPIGIEPHRLRLDTANVAHVSAILQPLARATGMRLDTFVSRDGSVAHYCTPGRTAQAGRSVRIAAPPPTPAAPTHAAHAAQAVRGHATQPARRAWGPGAGPGR